MHPFGTLAPRASKARRPLPHMLRALSHRDYRLWAAADLVSTVGSWMQLIAQNWVVLEITGSPAKLGITVAVQSLPAIALGMWGGNIADRLPRRRVLIATQTAFGLLAAALAVTTALDVINVGFVWAVAFLTGLVTAVNTPTVGALCADIVPEEDLGNAMALGAATSSTGRMLGMALAAWVVAAYGAQLAFAFNALSFVAVIAALALMRGAAAVSAAKKDAKNDASDGAWQGLLYVARSRNLLGLLGLCFVLSAFGRNFQVTMAAMVSGPLGGGAGAYGFLSTIFAAGTVVGAVVAARTTNFDASLLLRAAAIASALQIVSSLTPNTAGFAIIIAPIAVAAVVIDTASSFLVQTKCDPAFRGRAIAAASLVSAAAGTVGGPFLGWLATAAGARAALAVGGVVALSATLACVGLAAPVRQRVVLRIATMRSRWALAGR